jgi:hypothetical protein
LREVTAAGRALVIGNQLVDLVVGLRAEVHGPPLTVPCPNSHA